MLLVFLNDSAKTGTILISAVKRRHAIAQRAVSGDLLFNEDLTIDQSSDWLFAWERADQNCYARKMQSKKLSPVGYRLDVAFAY